MNPVLLCNRSTWLIRCFYLLSKSFPPPTFRFWLSPRGQMAKWKTFNTFTMTGFPLDKRNCTHTHTHTQTTHTCQRALPADELGHFSLPWLRGIKCVVMEHSHIEPKQWRDKSWLGCRTEPVEGHTYSSLSLLCLSLEYLRLSWGKMRERSEAAACSQRLLLSLLCFCFLYYVCLPTSSPVYSHFLSNLSAFTLFRLFPRESLSLSSLLKCACVGVSLLYTCPLTSPELQSPRGRYDGWWGGVKGRAACLCRIMSICWLYRANDSVSFPSRDHATVISWIESLCEGNIHCMPFYFRFTPLGLPCLLQCLSIVLQCLLLWVPYISVRVCTAETARSPRKLPWQLLFAS